MFQVSDQQDDGGTHPPSNPSVVSKAYPGLVLVPPSDRTILRRRLIRGALLIAAGLWLVSTFTARPPASNTPTNCQSEAGQPSTETTPENCASPPVATETDLRPSEVSLTQVSQVPAPVEARPLPAVPQLDPEQPQAPPMVEQPSPIHAELPQVRPEPQAGTKNHEKSAGNRPPEKPVVNLESDTHLAEQGDPFAQYRLGRRVAQQEGRRAPEAFGWYKKAFPGLHRLAETGNGQAMYVLGVMYAYGRGVERDISQARRWLTRAVEQKVTAAQPVLANLPLPARSSPALQVHAAESAKPRKQQN
jgi:uncharacterized protein